MNIKFKAWHKEKKYWVTDSEYIFLDDNGEAWSIEEQTLAYESYMNKENITDIVEIVNSIGQFDKFNNELFEGDICWFTPMLVETVPTFKGIIEWDKYRFTIRNLDYNNKNYLTMYATPFVDLDLFGLSVEKIGNKFENPELLIK